MKERLDYDCCGNLGSSEKKILAGLAVRRYRKISEGCGDNKIIAVDFLLLIMEIVDDIVKEHEIEHPNRQNIYKIAKLVYKELPHDFEILGNMDLNKEEITSTFNQEIRKYEQMGLIAYSREIRKLQSEVDSSKQVFRYDRRFRLSSFGKLRLKKVRLLASEGEVREYIQYNDSWQKVLKVIRQSKGKIAEICKDQNVP